MACAISIVLALVGFISMSSLPIEQYPNIAPPQVEVTIEGHLNGYRDHRRVFQAGC